MFEIEELKDHARELENRVAKLETALAGVDHAGEILTKQIARLEALVDVWLHAPGNEQLKAVWDALQLPAGMGAKVSGPGGL